MRCLRVILGVSLMDKIRNEEIRQRLHLPTTICDEVSKRRLKWFGHVVRMPPHRIPFQAYTRMTFSKEDHQDAHKPAGEIKLKGTCTFLWKRLNIKPKEDRNGEGSLVGEQRDTPSYAVKSSKSSHIVFINLIILYNCLWYNSIHLNTILHYEATKFINLVHSNPTDLRKLEWATRMKSLY